MSNVHELRSHIRDKYSDDFELDVGSDNGVVLTIVSDAFEGVTPEDRYREVSSLVAKRGFYAAIIEVYTRKEADEIGLVMESQKTAPATWADAVNMLRDGETPIKVDSERSFRRIVFYSYKGGVGRTTALVHAAFHLAREGKRVAVVDMDVEAPGLHLLLPRRDGLSTEMGLVDYLWERQVKPDVESGGEFSTSLISAGTSQAVGIAYSVEDPVSRAQVYVVPAGTASRDYVSRLSTLSYRDVLSRSDDAWSQFERELASQFAPDVVLIDARTGLGEWGGLSLLRLADEVCIVMFPSEQNVEGVRFVRSILADIKGVQVRLVFSPVPEGPIGREISARTASLLELVEDEVPVNVFYSPGIAGAPTLPVESAMPSYGALARQLTESQTEAKLEATLSKVDRATILKSLRFPERDAKSINEREFDMFFQKTSDFDKVLDDARWVIRGRKGTGKSTLFHLFVEHTDNARQRAKGKLDGVDVVPGHGPVIAFRPTTDEFAAIQKGVEANAADWISFWRVYLLVRLWVSGYEPLARALGEDKQFVDLKKFLKAHFSCAPSDTWRSGHSTASVALAAGPLNGLVRDVLSDLNTTLSDRGTKLWVLYDDLDQDIREESRWQAEALGGLLRLAYDSNNRDQHNIRFKIFLREDIWSKLVFTNKSHFGEPRTVLLQWRVEDFLRLAYRLAIKGSVEYFRLAQRELALSDEDIDSASEEDLQRALAPLWGYSQERGKKALAAKWVYSRMTDARDNTYPRSLTVLLNAARDEELNNPPKSPPGDRLLSPRSMQAGLKAASEERVNAVKNEYSALVPFLDNVQQKNSLRSQFTESELRAVWDAVSQAEFPTFDAFVAELEAAGLLVRKKGTTYDYGFASLYIDGLGVTRVQGEKK